MIDKETVDLILEKADIVYVVSKFVKLQRRGANYIGLCPFHSERTPSFSVSQARGICKCFSCGKGGSPVGFLMALENMSYPEALRWLAKEYNIPIKEKDKTPEEIEKEGERESLFAINQFALNHFERNLHETEEGRDIGLAYFMERSLTLETIKKFNLGYALERSPNPKYRDAPILEDALAHGYTEEYAIKAGLTKKGERGPYDPVRGRVMFPVKTVSGKIVAFGGRTLKSDKKIAKYVNSPETAIYKKSKELYGLFEAKSAISREHKCILVEGYMDVLSMSQAGVENVVASSGTSLTEQQIVQIKKFTDNVTVIYDADAAGIKASLRGIDMLLEKGINVKVVLFPEGEDPDSYARTHTREELALYLAENETDFIRFKTKVLLENAADDPMKISQTIIDILGSIAVIPNEITRQVYIDEVARAFDKSPRMLAREVARIRKKIADNNGPRYDNNKDDNNQQGDDADIPNPPQGDSTPVSTVEGPVTLPVKNPFEKYELSILKYLVRYGMLMLTDTYEKDGTVAPTTVLDFVMDELQSDGIEFQTLLHRRLLDKIISRAYSWKNYLPKLEEKLRQKESLLREEGLERIRKDATSLSQISRAEKDLEVNIAAEIAAEEAEERKSYIAKALVNEPEDDVRTIANNLVSDRYELSKMHSKFAHVATEEERLVDLVPRAVLELKEAILRKQLDDIKQKLASTTDAEESDKIMQEYQEKKNLGSQLAGYLGDRIITPRIKH